MKFTLNIDKSLDEEIILNVHQKSKLVEDIEKLVQSYELELLCYDEDKSAFVVDFSDIHCFIVENNKVYAYTDNNKYTIKHRLYQIEDMLPPNFIKVNQSCIGNIKKIERFDTSLNGSLIIRFKCGYKDCVSRRQLKRFKERFGL